MAKSIVALESLLAAVPAALSHGLFAEARTIPLSVDQILFSAGDEGDGCYRRRLGQRVRRVEASLDPDQGSGAARAALNVLKAATLVVADRGSASNRGTPMTHKRSSDSLFSDCYA
jgi:hypothetical protein